MGDARLVRAGGGASVDGDDPATRGGNAPDGRKVKSTIHLVSASHALDFEARLYESLFLGSNAGEESESDLNPKSLEVRAGAKIEPSVSGASPGAMYQFERVGYFCVDKDSTAKKLVFNRTVQLRDTWAKIEKSAHSKSA